MARRCRWTVLALLLLAASAPAAANPWGDLKKIHFYEANHDTAAVQRLLAGLDAQSLTPSDCSGLAARLSELGDRYQRQGQFSLAEAFYRKALAVSPHDAWPAYNKIETIARRRGRLTWNFARVGRQFQLLTRNFATGYMLLDGLLDVLVFSGLLLFFVVAAALGVRYFRLAAHDAILATQTRFQPLPLLLLLALLLWPLLLTGGWAFYPFLLCGLLWSYLNHDERVNLKRILALLVFLALLNSFGLYLENSLRSEGFQTVRRLHSGQVFPEPEFSRFDNELKVMQAYGLYHAGDSRGALDALQETGSQYATPLKYNLQAGIHFEQGNYPLSIQLFRQSLSLDDRRGPTLKNFTLALLRHNDPELFQFYARSYPRITVLKDQVTSLQKERLPDAILWRRLLRFSWHRFHPWHFLKELATCFLAFPALWAMLLLAAYVPLLRRIFPALGQSVFCSKCGKIIRKLAIEQAQSHALCEGCYQLFLIKDAIFLEAKMLKEKEISRQLSLKNRLLLACSLLIPGFILNFRKQGRSFSPLFFACFFTFALFLFPTLNFRSLFGTAPLVLNLVGMAAALVYLAVALWSLREEPDGL